MITIGDAILAINLDAVFDYESVGSNNLEKYNQTHRQRRHTSKI